MSQTHAVALPSRSRARWLGPLILVTVVLALITPALVQGDGGQTVSPTTASKYAPPPLVTPRPDESKVAAAIGAGVTPAPSAARPDESEVAVAAASAFDPASEVAWPGESTSAAAIAAGSGGIYDDAPKRKSQQYDGVIGSLSQGERDAAFVRGHQRGGR
jgi:hypothetical protein